MDLQIGILEAEMEEVRCNDTLSQDEKDVRITTLQEEIDRLEELLEKGYDIEPAYEDGENNE